MKPLNFIFAFVLVTAMASIGVAAEKSGEKVSFKAELSGVAVPPVATRATGEAVFELVGGAGAGGTDLSESRGVQEGIPGAGVEDGRGAGGDSYEGIIEEPMTESGGGAGGGEAMDSYDRSEEKPLSKSEEGAVDQGYEGIDRPFESGEGAGGAGMGETLKYKLNVKNIENVTAAHLHMGKRSTKEGPVIAPLYTGPKKSGEFSGMLSEGTITAKDLKGPLSGKSIQDLVRLIDSGDVYVNVHTEKNPAGEIRGQVKEEAKS